MSVEKGQKSEINLDCEQSLSFPSVFRAIEEGRANERAVSGEPRTARSAGAERDCGGIFDLFDLPPLTPV